MQNDITHKVVIPEHKRRKSIVEPAIHSANKPITHGLLVFNDQTNNYMPISLRHTYANNTVHFSNVTLNNNLQNIKNNHLDSINRHGQIYDSIKELYTENAGSVDNLFAYVNISETIYPRARNTYLKRSFTRTEYNVKTVLGWRAGRSDRDTTGKTNSQGKLVAPSLPSSTNQSSWPLDGRYNKDSFVDGEALIIEPGSGTQIPTQNDGAGELLNCYGKNDYYK